MTANSYAIFLQFLFHNNRMIRQAHGHPEWRLYFKPPLQTGLAIRLNFGHWDISRCDVWSIWVVTLNGKDITYPSLLPSPLTGHDEPSLTMYIDDILNMAEYHGRRNLVSWLIHWAVWLHRPWPCLHPESYIRNKSTSILLNPLFSQFSVTATRTTS